MRGLNGGAGESAENGEAAENAENQYSTYKWRTYATRICRFFYKIDDDHHCNTYYTSRWSRVARRAVGRGRPNTKRTHSIPIGIYHDTSAGKKRGISESYTYVLSDEEVFARRQVIGEPEAGNFGFIHAAEIARFVDEDTIELRSIKLVPDDTEQEYDELHDEARAWALDKSRELVDKARRYHRRIPREDRFTNEYPSVDELEELREQIVDERFKGRLEMLELQEAWEGMTVMLHGVDGERYERQQIDTYEDTSTPLILTARRGRTFHAATPRLLRKVKIARDDLLEIVKDAGYEPSRFIAMVETLKEQRHDEHSTWRRAALILAGRPTSHDRDIARQFRGPADN